MCFKEFCFYIACVNIVAFQCLYFQNVANTISRVLDLRCKEAWFRIQLSQPQALIDLMSAVEKYTSVLAHNMPQTFTQPFDAVHDNIGTVADYTSHYMPISL